MLHMSAPATSFALTRQQVLGCEKGTRVVVLLGHALLTGAAAGLEGGVLQKRRIALAQIDQHLARGVADRSRQAFGAAPEEGLVKDARVQVRTAGRRLPQTPNLPP